MEQHNSLEELEEIKENRLAHAVSRFSDIYCEPVAYQIGKLASKIFLIAAVVVFAIEFDPAPESQPLKNGLSFSDCSGSLF